MLVNLKTAKALGLTIPPSLLGRLSHLKRVREHFGLWRAAELQDEAVDTYIQKRVDAGAPPATINRETQLLGQAYTLATRSKPPHVTAKPNIRRLSEKGNVRKDFFEPAEFEAVVNALPEYLQDVARFAYLTGWRRGDMFGLRWSAVDMRRGVIRLFQGETKSDEGRHWPLPDHWRKSWLGDKRRGWWNDGTVSP